MDKRDSKSGPDTGTVGIEHHGYNKDGDLVCVVRRTALMLPHAENSVSAASN